MNAAQPLRARTSVRASSLGQVQGRRHRRPAPQDTLGGASAAPAVAATIPSTVSTEALASLTTVASKTLLAALTRSTFLLIVQARAVELFTGAVAGPFAETVLAAGRSKAGPLNC